MKLFQLVTETPSNQEKRCTFEKLLNTALQAADPYQLVKNRLTINQTELTINANNKNISLDHGLHVISIGKASLPMMQAVLDYAGEYVISGVCVTKQNIQQQFFPSRIQVFQGGHPIPNIQSLQAAQSIKSLLWESTENVPVLCLISGGGSSLVIYPSSGISLQDYQSVNRLLISENVRIEEINCIRKHMDEFKGGGLLRWINPEKRDFQSLVLSDVVTDDLATIASGPTVPDISTFQEASNILHSKQLWNRVPLAVRDHIEKGLTGLIPDTIKPEESQPAHLYYQIIGSLLISMEAIADEANRSGWEPLVHLPPFQEDVESVAGWIMKNILSEHNGNRDQCLVFGGEATIKIHGNGKGGRNSHLALLLAKKIAGMEKVSIVTFASDGEDGNSPAAGAIIDGNTCSRANQAGLDVDEYLSRNDTYTLFNKLHDAIEIGSTGTNINDLVIVLRER